MIETYTKEKQREQDEGERGTHGHGGRGGCKGDTPIDPAACCQYSNEQFSQLIEAELIAIDFRLAIQSAQSSLVCVLAQTQNIN